MPLKVAICGLGSAAHRAHLPALALAEERGDATIVGVCDRHPDRLGDVVRARPLTAGFRSVTAMLDETMPDLLVVATPPSAHLRAIEAAAKRQVHVLCEKPLGLSAGDVAELERLRRTHPALAFVTVYQYRHASPWRTFSRVIQDAARRGEPFRLRITVERPGTDPLSAGDWRNHPEREGGIFGDHAVHYLDLCWSLDPDLDIVDVHREDHLSGTARLNLRVLSGEVELVTTYAGSRRCNSFVLERPGCVTTVSWVDGEFRMDRSGSSREPRRVGALSARDYVNQLYRCLYEDIFANLGDAEWRRQRTRQTVAVARLLASAIAAVA